MPDVRLRVTAIRVLIVGVLLMLAAFTGFAQLGLIPSTGQLPTVTATICPAGNVGSPSAISFAPPSGLPGFHAAWVGQSGHITMCPGDTADLAVTYRNTGTSAWTQGNAEARLGTYGPEPGQDRPSVLGGSSIGWTHDVRPAAQPRPTVAPGEDAEFKFAIRAPSEPGIYRLYVRPLIEGRVWLEDYGIYFQVTVLKADGTSSCPQQQAPPDLPPPSSVVTGRAGFHAAWYGQSGHPTVCPGQLVTLRVTFRNSGTSAWTQGSAEARIGTDAPDPGQDRPSVLGGFSTGWFHPVRPARQPVPTVGPGQDAIFEVRLHAPRAAGVHRLHVRPLIEGVTWLNETASFQLTVLNQDGSPPCASGTPGFHSRWHSQSDHVTLRPGQQAAINVKYCNAGSRAWTQGGPEARLGTYGPEPGQDQVSPVGGTATGWVHAVRPARQSAPTVGPGEIATFQFTVQAPATPGIYRLHIRPLIEGTAWLEDDGIYFQVTVLNADGTSTCTASPPSGQLTSAFPAASGLPGFHAAWVGQTEHPTLCPGQPFAATLRYRNTGTATWTKGGAEARLGTYGPEPGQDNVSVLGGFSTGWTHAVRPAAQQEATVAPGQEATFRVSLHAPKAPGVYRLYVRPLIEGTAWLEDYAIYVQVTVLKADGTSMCTSTEPAALPAPASVGGGLSGFHSAWYGQTGHPTLCPGQRSVLKVTFFNSGTQAWTQGTAEARLGTNWHEPGPDRPSILGGLSTGWFHPIRAARQSSATVAPNATQEFEIGIHAPTKPGLYWLFVRPLIEGVTWLEDQGVFWRITVLNADGSQPRIACGSDCWPLRGTGLNGDAGRRGINVRIDNASAARPHYGISQADIVFESLIDSFNITRLSMMLHSQDPGTLGSVRSARLVDRYLTPMIRGGIAFAGSTDEEHALIRQDDASGRYMDLSFNTPGRGDAYYRVGFRSSPYNLFTSSSALRREMAEAIGASACRGCVEPVQIPRWGFLAGDVAHPAHAGGAIGSMGATNITVPNPSSAVVVNYRYDAGSGTYARFQGGVREVDAANGVAVNPRNVVVIHTDIWFTNIYEDNFNRPPEFRSRGLDMCLAKDADLWPGDFAGKPASCSGTGAATIFRDGVRIDGTWQRNSINDAFAFVNRYGEPILLSPGMTWVHIIPNTWSVPSN